MKTASEYRAKAVELLQKAEAAAPADRAHFVVIADRYIQLAYNFNDSNDKPESPNKR